MNHLTQALEPETHDIEAPFDMANLRPATTGLPFVVFVSQQPGARRGPRIELSPLPRYNSAEAITVTLQSPPQAIGTLAPPTSPGHHLDRKQPRNSRSLLARHHRIHRRPDRPNQPALI